MSIQYRIVLDTQRDYSFTGYYNNILPYVKRVTWQYGALAPYDSIGASAYMEIVLNNAKGEFDMQNPSARYYGKLRRGTLVGVFATVPNYLEYQQCILKIQDKVPVYKMDGSHELILKCTDVSQDFFNKDFIAPLLTNVRVDEILTAAHAGTNAIWPYEGYYQFLDHTSLDDGRELFDGTIWVDFDTAETELAFYGDNLDRGQGVKVQEYIKNAVMAEAGGLYFYSPKTSVFTFLSRYHAEEQDVSWNITTAITAEPIYTEGRDLKNDFSLSYYPRAIGAENTVLWESDNLPLRIAGRDTKRITMKYRDPDNPDAAVGALVVNDIVKGTDIISNSLEDGSGSNQDNRIDITLVKGAASSEIVISNRRRGNPVFIQTLQVRGTPITAYNKETVYSYNDDSVFGLGSDASTGNDRASASETLNAVSDTDFAQAYADYIVSVFGDPIVSVERLTVYVKAADAPTQRKILITDVGDVINFTDTKNHHDTDYMIVGQQHTISPNTEPPMHTVSYTLRPTARGALFIIGESYSNGGDILSF